MVVMVASRLEVGCDTVCKTLLALFSSVCLALAGVTGLSFDRVQCSSDLLPLDKRLPSNLEYQSNMNDMQFC